MYRDDHLSDRSIKRYARLPRDKRLYSIAKDFILATDSESFMERKRRKIARKKYKHVFATMYILNGKENKDYIP